MLFGTISNMSSGALPARALPYPVDFVPLDQETRTHVSTAVMCHHIGRKVQTARGWACYEDGPLRPIRVNGRLAWAVADIRRLLGVVSKVGA
jgi:hypothetical protein